jgi:hypothetical protein
MKRIIIALSILLVSVTSFAQNHFKAVDYKVIWQNIYESNVDIHTFYDWLVSSGQCQDIVVSGNTITCKFIDAPIDYQRFGFSSMNISILVRDNNIRYNATFQFKDGRYRVTLDQFQFVQRYDSSLYKMGEETYMERIALNKKGEFKSIIQSGTLDVLDVILVNKCAYYEPSHLNDEW